MTRTQIYLPEEMVLQIKLAAKRQNVKMSELIRELLAKGLNNHAKKTKKKTLADMVGIFSTNSDPNGARDHNSIYNI